MESETASSADEHVGPSDGVGGSNDNRGKHRILAELKHLEQELKCLEVINSFLFSFFLGCGMCCCLFPEKVESEPQKEKKEEVIYF